MRPSAFFSYTNALAIMAAGAGLISVAGMLEHGQGHGALWIVRSAGVCLLGWGVIFTALIWRALDKVGPASGLNRARGSAAEWEQLRASALTIAKERLRRNALYTLIPILGLVASIIAILLGPQWTPFALALVVLLSGVMSLHYLGPASARSVDHARRHLTLMAAVGGTAPDPASMRPFAVFGRHRLYVWWGNALDCLIEAVASAKR